MKPRGNMYGSGRNYDYGTDLNDNSEEINNSSSNDYYDQIPNRQAQTMKHNVPIANKYDVNNPTYGLSSIGLSGVGKNGNLMSGMNLGLSSSNTYGKKSDAYNIDLNTNKYDFKIEKESAKQNKSKDNDKSKDRSKEKEKKKEQKQNVDFFDQLDDELEQRKSEEDNESSHNNYDEYENKSIQPNEEKGLENTKPLFDINIKKNDSIKEDIQESIQQDQEESGKKKNSITNEEKYESNFLKKIDDYDQPDESYNKYVPNQPHSAEAMEEYMKKHTIFPIKKDNEATIEEKEEKKEDDVEDEYKESFNVNVDTLQNQSNDYNNLHKLSDTSMKNYTRKQSSNLEESDKKILDESIKEKIKSDANHNPTESLDIDLSERMKILNDNKKITTPQHIKSVGTDEKMTESNEIDFTNRLKLLFNEKEETQSKAAMSPFKAKDNINKDPEQSQVEHKPIEQIKPQNLNSPNGNNNISSDDVQSLIRKEIGNYIKSGNLNTLLSMNSNVNQSDHQQLYNSTGIKEIKNELDKLVISKNQLFSEGLRFKKFDHQKLYRSTNISALFEGYPGFKPKTNITQMKLESSLNEERKRKELVSYELNQVKELNKKLEEELSKLQYVKLDNLNLSKKIESSESQIVKMKNDFDELKSIYDHQIKLIEERIQSTAETSANHKTNEMEKKFQMEIIVLQSALDEVKLEAAFFKSKNEALDNENTRLRLNIEQNDAVAKLKNENYVLHEKNNELMKIKESFELELQRLKEVVASNSNNSGGNLRLQEANVNLSSSVCNKSDAVFVNQIQLNKNGIIQTVFEQLMNERESNAQENLIKSYVKEIERLNEEVAFLKSMPNGEVMKGNYVNVNKKKINPLLQESIEEQMKKLQSFFFKEENKYLIQFIEKEFHRLQDKEHEGEIAFNNFISILQNTNMPLMPNELIEIFNNFPRSHGNMIRYGAFLSALLSKSPSAFYMQSDPSYLNTLESKLLIATNRVKELEKFILVSASEKDDQKGTIDELTKIKSTLEDKVNQLNGQILNYFLYREEKQMANPEIIQMKEKFKSLETNNKNAQNEQYQRLASYEKKIEEMKNSDKERDNLSKEITAMKETISKMKTESVNKETALNNEINTLHQKLSKYKKNYQALQSKNESLGKEKEKILNCLKEKGITAEKVLAFVNSYEEVKILNAKLSELEKKNENREERYKQLCANANAIQLHKEIETMTKHYEREKGEMIKIIHQKNSEVEIIKKEFSEIMLELEKMKVSKYK